MIAGWEMLFLYLVQVNGITGLIIAGSTKTVSTFIEFKFKDCFCFPKFFIFSMQVIENEV